MAGRTVKKTTPRATTAKRTVSRAPAPEPEPEPTNQMRQEIVSTVQLGDNREIRVVRIQTGLSEDLIRVGINLLSTGENMSGAVFPASYLDNVVLALRKAV